MSTTTRILILAQTEPCFSKQYLETVCTAGITEEGKWIRLYPLRKRMLSTTKDYQKYQWIECAIDPTSNPQDHRPESHKIDQDSIIPKDLVSADNKWSARKRILLTDKIHVYTTREEILKGARENTFSLCLFKPSFVTKFFGEFVGDEFSVEEKRIIQQHRSQGILFSFDDELTPCDLNFSKVPYSFRCKFKDANGAEMKLSVLDWEMSTLYRKCRKDADREQAMEKTLNKYNSFIPSKDLYFILGTRNEDHNKLICKPELNINPWSIISVIYFPKDMQLQLPL